MRTFSTFKIMLGIALLLVGCTRGALASDSETFVDQPDERSAEKQGSKILRSFSKAVHESKDPWTQQMKERAGRIGVESNQLVASITDSKLLNNFIVNILILLIFLGLGREVYRANKSDPGLENTEKQDERQSPEPASLDLEEAFQVLGLKSNASISEITRAYRRLIVKNHPDKLFNSTPAMIKLAEERSKKIILAKEKCLKAVKTRT